MIVKATIDVENSSISHENPTVQLSQPTYPRVIYTRGVTHAARSARARRSRPITNQLATAPFCKHINN